tara:strand:+ start:6662 stop:7513 length:852 start_codon:yes stop_codon:yes gene_type:complete
MKIGMIGMGFVGGTTSKIFETKHEVFCYDKYKEPYTNPEVLKNSEVIFICVPTPMKPSGEIDYSAIYDALEILDKIFKNSLNKPTIVIRSTIVPGTTEKLAKQYDFNFVFNPEFLREKFAVEDFIETNRIVIGTTNAEDYKKVRKIYNEIFPESKVKYLLVSPKTAEMIKYSSNVMLASQIGLANEIYQICEKIGVEYNEIKDAISLDPRIAKNINVPGPDNDFGFGGKCFPKDLNALIYLARESGYRPHLLEEVWRLNERVRKNKDWNNIPGATSENNNFQD